jgi:hypothetical protein
MINKNSDSAAVITALFQTLHDDIQQETKEIWFSIKDVTKHISFFCTYSARNENLIREMI